MHQVSGIAIVLFRRGLVDGGDWRLIPGSVAAFAPHDGSTPS